MDEMSGFVRHRISRKALLQMSLELSFMSPLAESQIYNIADTLSQWICVDKVVDTTPMSISNVQERSIPASNHIDYRSPCCCGVVDRWPAEYLEYIEDIAGVRSGGQIWSDPVRGN